MADKCPHCKSANTELVSVTEKYSNTQKGVAGAAAIGLAIVGASVGGPIGAAAGGAVGTWLSNGLSGVATENHGKRKLRCKSCGHEWIEDY